MTLLYCSLTSQLKLVDFYERKKEFLLSFRSNLTRNISTAIRARHIIFASKCQAITPLTNHRNKISKKVSEGGTPNNLMSAPQKNQFLYFFEKISAMKFFIFTKFCGKVVQNLIPKRIAKKYLKSVQVETRK